MKPEIVLLRSASSVATCAIWPPVPLADAGAEMAVYWAWASVCAAVICERTLASESANEVPCSTSACLADASFGFCDRLDQASQNFDSCLLMPLSPGSA